MLNVKFKKALLNAAIVTTSTSILLGSTCNVLAANSIDTEIEPNPSHKEQCDDEHCPIVPNPGAMSNDSKVHSREFDVISGNRPLAPNSEMLLPQKRWSNTPSNEQQWSESFTFWGLDEIKTDNNFNGKTVVTENEISETTSVASKEKVESIQFVSGKNLINDQYVEKLRDVLKRLKNLSNVRIHFIGHTDSEKLSAKSRAIYGDNYGLGKSRAKRTALYFKEKLNLPEAAISYEGKGPDEPIASNDTLEGMALNRRVEVQVWFDQTVTHKQKKERFIPDPAVQRTQVCQQQIMCQRIENRDNAKRVVFEHAIAPIRFNSSQTDIPDSYVKEIENILKSISDKDDIQLKFIGHSDNQRISSLFSRIFSDNKALSLSRAKHAADYFEKKLLLPKNAIHIEGRGDSEPVADNNTAQGRALNRRVEIEVSYRIKSVESAPALGEIVQCPSGDLPENLQRLDAKQTADAFTMTPWRISIDGEPVDDTSLSADATALPRHSADNQRCTDIALEDAQLQLHYDGLLLQPMLNVAVWPDIAVTNQTLYFRAWNNYPHWIKRAEVIIYSLGYENQKQIIDRVELNKDFEASWQVPETTSNEIWYSLRVYDSVDNEYPYFDETIAKKIRTADAYPDKKPDLKDKETTLRAGYGKNSLLKQNIPVVGGTITANGINVPKDKNIWVMGQAVPLDDNGAFIAQQIIPDGLHTAEIAVLDDNGNGELLWRDLEIKKNDWFYVGIADLTLSLNSQSGPAELVTGDRDLNDDFTTVGRIAMYAKGKVDDKYIVTTSLDSREEPLDELFSNFHKKDPASILRRLDSEDYYPTFGDDSTLYEDAPTQGKFYVKIEDEKSHALWGNFKLNLTENELATINRGLYGGHARFQSQKFTLSGERETRIDMFAAEPGTIPSYEEFRGTGGSLYYLKHRDITRGSEQIRIEVRDKDSGIILSSTPMLSGQDYEIDELQGIVLLTQPLASTATGSDLVHSSSLSGHPVSMVINYEYVPGFTELNNIAVGGRAEHWLTDNLQLGATISNQDQTGGKQKLGSVDVTLKKSDTTWLKVTAAKSEGPGITQQQSDDGGFDFSTSTSGVTNTSANATRVEGTASLQELGVDLPLQGSFFWQDREAGFSAPGQQTSNDVTETGASVSSQITNKTEVAARYKERDEKNARYKQTIEADLKQQLDRNWLLSAGARNDDIQNKATANKTGLGERTDVVLRADYDSKKNWDAYTFAQGTVDNDKTRQENDRIGIGAGWEPTDTLRLTGEVSDGDLGTGVIAGADLVATERTNLYLNYALDSDNPESGIGGNKSTTIFGGRTRFSDYASIYGEEKYTDGNQPRGLTQTYGIDLAADEHWTYGMTLELGKLNSETAGEIKRKAIGLRLGYSANRSIYAGAVEFRIDESVTEKRDSWLVRNSYKYQSNPDWRLLTRLDFAISESNKGKAFDADFIEAVTGYAWRPVDNDRWNGLFKYTYFYDLTSPDQLTPTEASIDFQQRSHVLAFDLNYDLTKRWTIGGKYAFRRSELRDRLETSGWFRSDAHLVILRTDWHVVKKWDVLTEARLLDLPDAGDTREGALIGVYRHVNEHFKFGLGYNFTDFSDDLTDLNYDSQGVFINMVGKI